MSHKHKAQSTKHYVSIDVGGTNARLALVTVTADSASLEKQISFQVPQEYKVGIQKIIDEIELLIEGVPVVGIGGNFPGIINHSQGWIESTVNLPQWRHQPLRDPLQEKFGVEVKIYHDVGAAALGEAVYGSGKLIPVFNFIIWGTGFGGAKVHHFADTYIISSFEPGHHIANSTGQVCSCGLRGCPELTIGGGALAKKYGELHQIKDDSNIWSEVIEAATVALANTQMFHPAPLYVFGGGLILKRPFLLFEVQKKLAQLKGFFPQPTFQVTSLGDEAALYGGAAFFEKKVVTLG